MAIEMNRLNKECPECKNPTIFDVNGKSYFCGKCLSEFNEDMTIKSQPVLEQESAKIIRDSPDTVEEIKVLQEDQPEMPEVDTDVMLSPDVLVQEQHEIV